MKPSKYHNNRRLYNWILYKQGDKDLQRYSKYYIGNLIDLGCGESVYKNFFLQYCDTYTGVDWAKTMHNSKADIVSDLNKKIELKDEFADTIISLSVMEHLCEPQVFLNESYRILKKNGYMILQVPWQWQLHETPYDYFRYTPYGLKYLFKKYGFKNIKVEAATGIFTVLIVKLNYFSLQFIRGPKILKFLIKLCLIPFWFIGQLLAPLLDKLDRNWAAETQGYYVIAKK